MLNVRGSILNLSQEVLDYSPFFRTLFTTDHPVEKDVNGIIVFDKFSQEEMKIYMTYCNTGKLCCPIQCIRQRFRFARKIL